MNGPADHAKAAEAWAMLSGLFEASRLIPPVQRAVPGTLPLTVISGFLGAGKTTLLNHLLVEPHGRRLAVLVNDFGRIEIDAALIRSWHEDTISLANGCACCSVAGDLTRTLVGLAQRPEPPEAIVLEASGLADPRGIAQVALANPALRLDGVLTVVDAETLGARLADPASRDTVLAQLSAADLILLNKLDLLNEARRAAARAELDMTAPGRSIVETVRAALPIEVALGIQTARRPGSAPAFGHAEPFRSWELTAGAPLDRDRLRQVLERLPDSVLRAKGILCLSDDPGCRTVYQRVGPRWSLTAASGWEGSARQSTLVLIGTAGALEAGALRSQWEACLASPAGLPPPIEEGSAV